MKSFGTTVTSENSGKELPLDFMLIGMTGDEDGGRSLFCLMLSSTKEIVRFLLLVLLLLLLPVTFDLLEWLVSFGGGEAQ